VIELSLSDSCPFADETHTRSIAPTDYRTNAVLLDSAPSESETMVPCSNRAYHQPPSPFDRLNPICALLQRYDIVIMLARFGGRILLVRSVSNLDRLYRNRDHLDLC
jgi:hypothetical protein